MPIVRPDYLERFHAIVLESFPDVLSPGNGKLDDLSVGIIRRLWERRKADRDSEEFAEIMLGEIFKASGRPYNAHQIQHFLDFAGVPDPKEVIERPPPILNL